jgi:hypothetical protein
VPPAATRTDLWQRAGIDINTLPEVMEVDELVDAALLASIAVNGDHSAAARARTLGCAGCCPSGAAVGHSASTGGRALSQLKAPAHNCQAHL